MSDIIVDGMTTVWFVPVIAAANGNPTIAELNGGHRISRWMTPTGLAGFEVSQAEVDNSGLESNSDSKLPGRKSYSGTSITFKKQKSGSADYTAYQNAITAMAENTNGNIVIRDGVPAATAPVADVPVETYVVRTGEGSHVGRGETNSLLRLMVPTPVSGQVNKAAKILAL